jgi:hypothetical protein
LINLAYLLSFCSVLLYSREAHDFLTHTLAPAKPHCCGKALNATSAREVGDGVVAQSGR